MGFSDNISTLRGSKALYFWALTFDEGEDSELILNPRRLYLETEAGLLQVSDIEGRLDIRITDRIHFSGTESSHKIDMRSFVLDYPEETCRIEKISAVNAEAGEDSAVCDALEIVLRAESHGEQTLFIHSGLFGIRLREPKESWLKNWYTPLHGKQPEERRFF